MSDPLGFLETVARSLNLGFVVDGAQATYLGNMYGVNGPALALGMLWRFAALPPAGCS